VAGLEDRLLPLVTISGAAVCASNVIFLSGAVIASVVNLKDPPRERGLHMWTSGNRGSKPTENPGNVGSFGMGGQGVPMGKAGLQKR
jgi:hypothetical protein